jgi:hypothetical protein
MSNPVQCRLSNGFSVREKLYAQLSFFVMGIVGIAREDWRWPARASISSQPCLPSNQFDADTFGYFES